MMQHGRAKDRRHAVIGSRAHLRIADKASASTITKVSRDDSLHDVVIGLKPLVEEARRDGNDKPFQIFRNLEAEDDLHGDYQKPVGDNVAVVGLVLESLPKSRSEIIRGKASGAMALLEIGEGTQSTEQRLKSIELLRGLLDQQNLKEG